MKKYGIIILDDKVILVEDYIEVNGQIKSGKIVEPPFSEELQKFLDNLELKKK